MTIQSDGIRDISVEEIQINNKKAQEDNKPEEVVDMSHVAICRKIRTLARINTIIVRTDAHSNQNARNLLAYLDFCGIDVNDYISDYLQHLQPYMIERKEDEEYANNVICIIDKLYNISLYIKIEKPTDSDKEYTVVSFHEDYKYKDGKPIAKQNSVLRKEDIIAAKQIYVPVFIDSYRSIDLTNQTAFINAYIQRGLLTLKLSLPTKARCKDVYFVRKADIEQAFLNYCNTYIEDLYASDLNLDFSQIDIFTMLQQVSFTSYGKDSFSSLSLLIDSLFEQKDPFSIKAADFAISTYTLNLLLTEEEKADLIHLISEKYKIINRKGMEALAPRLICLIHEDNPNRYIVKTTNKKPTGNGEGGDDGDADGTESFGSSSEKKTDSERDDDDVSPIPDASVSTDNNSGKETGESDKTDGDTKNCNNIAISEEENDEHEEPCI